VLLSILEVLSILLTAFVVGVYWGPWLALTRSIGSFAPDVFLAIVHRMDRNLGTNMTVLVPITLLSIAAVSVFSFGRPTVFALSFIALLLMVVTLIVTVAVEVPIVGRIRGWSTPQDMPTDWHQQRDRWVSFHLARVLPGIASLACLVVAGVFGSTP
jgi:uncharacterized membrane protein